MTPEFFTSVINGYLPEPQASLLNGIIFGVNLKTSKVFYDQLKIDGLLHLVVLSGTNITLLITIIAQMTRFFSKQTSILIAMLTIIIFIIFVGPQAPVIRAAFMGILTLVAILYGRKNLALYSLLLSALFIAFFWPQWLKTLSFQLSYGATLGMIIFNKNDGGKGLANYIKSELRTSLAAQVFTVPLIFLYFKQVSLISPIANILVSWLIAPLMVLGFLTAFLGKINYILGLIPAYICHGLLTYMVFVVETLSKVPFAFFQFK
jgi:competence protein ComEC